MAGGYDGGVAGHGEHIAQVGDACSIVCTAPSQAWNPATGTVDNGTLTVDFGTAGQISGTVQGNGDIKWQNGQSWALDPPAPPPPPAPPGPVRCHTAADCSALPACPVQPPAYAMYQQHKECLLERARPGARARRAARQPPRPPGVCVCEVPKFNCPVPGPQSRSSVAEVEMIMLHPPGPGFSLSSHNTGDLMGDTWFACRDPSASKFGDTLFTQSIVAVNASYGAYARCTDSVPPHLPCDKSAFGGDGVSVGRALPLFENTVDRAKLGPGYSGQCANNTAGGTWYSMPANGRCADGGAAQVCARHAVTKPPRPIGTLLVFSSLASPCARPQHVRESQQTRRESPTAGAIHHCPQPNQTLRQC